MCEGTDLLERLKKTRPRVLDDEVMEYAQELKKDKRKAQEFLIRAGIHDKNGHLIQRAR